MFILFKIFLIVISLIIILLICIISFFGFSIYDLIYYTSITTTNDFIQNEIENGINELLKKHKNGFLIIENLNNINRIYNNIKFDYITNILIIDKYNINMTDKEKLYTLFI